MFENLWAILVGLGFLFLVVSAIRWILGTSQIAKDLSALRKKADHLDTQIYALHKTLMSIEKSIQNKSNKQIQVAKKSPVSTE